MSIDQNLQRHQAALEELSRPRRRPWWTYAVAIGVPVILALLAVAWWLGLLTPEPGRATLEDAVATVENEAGNDTEVSTDTDTVASEAVVTDTTAAPTDDADAAVDNENGSESAIAVEIAGEWAVVASDATFVGYRADSQVGEAVGRSSGVTGELTATESEITAVSLTADMTQLTSDSSLRDDHLGDEGLEYNTYPTSTFVLTESIMLPAAIETDVEVAFDAVGELTVRDITQTVNLALSGILLDDSLIVVGSTDIDLDDFGASVSSTDEATMEFSIVFER